MTARPASNGMARSDLGECQWPVHAGGCSGGRIRCESFRRRGRRVSRRVTLEVRDRGVLSAMLRQADSGSVVVAVIGRRHGWRHGRWPLRNLDGPWLALSAGSGRRRWGRHDADAGADCDGGSHGRASVSSDGWRWRDSMAASSVTVAKVEPAAPAAHVRSYFPEALYINPEIITDQNGAASITIPLADSITTWRMAMMASTTHGALGSGVSSLKVFQDFFVDLDLPVTLTQGDRVSIPVAVYNYSAARGDVRLELKKEDWFALVEDNAGKTRGGGCRDSVGASQFTHRGAAHRKVQADAGRAHERRQQSGGHRGARDRSGAQRPRAERGVQRAPGNRRRARSEFSAGGHCRTPARCSCGCIPAR